MHRIPEVRTYLRADSIVFCKTTEAYGGLSNMAAGYPIRVNGVRIRTSEALYQACRFPHLPDVQRLIIEESSPMTAKMKSKPYRNESRPDWERVRVTVMRWCLRVKLAQNWSTFSRLLLATGDRPIVEESRKDDFWGAKVVDADTLTGMNVLGRLLMELREKIKQPNSEQFRSVEPPVLAEFVLFGEPITVVEAQQVSGGPATVVSVNGGDSATRLNSVAPRIQDQSVFEGSAAGGVNVTVGPLIDRLKPYPEYKESTLPWVGVIPRHWEERRAKYFFREVDDRSVSGKEELLSVSHLTGVTPRREKTVTMFLAKSNVGHKVVRPDDVVINTMWAWMAALGVARCAGLVSPSYGVYRPSENHLTPGYVDHLLRTPGYAAEYLCRSTGINSSRLRLYPEQFLRIPLVCPPSSEQVAIVGFLDHANRRISRFISAKRKVIALLNEQKRAIIHRAVKLGIDSNVRLKPSGISWLGDIPQHWEVSRVKNEFMCLNSRRIPLSSVERGMMTGKLYDYYGASGIIDKVDGYLFDDDLLLIAEDGANLVLRNLPLAIVVRGKCWVNNHAHILKPKRGNLEYLAGFMETLNYQPWISGAAQPKLTKDRLLSISIAVAPPSEQESIVAHFSEEIRPLLTAIQRTEREVALMREYRARLVADVVTGKVDVREAAKQFPVQMKGSETQGVEEEPTEEAEMIEDEQIA